MSCYRIRKENTILCKEPSINSIGVIALVSETPILMDYHVR